MRQELWAGWEPSKLPLGKRCCTPWSSCQLLLGLAYRDNSTQFNRIYIARYNKIVIVIKKGLYRNPQPGPLTIVARKTSLIIERVLEQGIVLLMAGWVNEARYTWIIIKRMLNKYNPYTLAFIPKVNLELPIPLSPKCMSYRMKPEHPERPHTDAGR